MYKFTSKIKFKLDEHGSLYFMRNGKWVKQYCPFDPNENQLSCGDWCPLFQLILEREPKLQLNCAQNWNNKLYTYEEESINENH